MVTNLKFLKDRQRFCILTMFCTFIFLDKFINPYSLLLMLKILVLTNRSSPKLFEPKLKTQFVTSKSTTYKNTIIQFKKNTLTFTNVCEYI